MRLENDIDWNQARIKFQRFLARHLNIDVLSVDIEGIIWDDNSCWYIMNGTEALIKALFGDRNHWRIKAVAPIVAGFGIGVLKR